AFSRRDDGGDETSADRAAELCILRAQGCAAIAADHTDGARLESGHGNRGLPTRPRTRRLGAFLAKRLFESRRTQGGHRFISRAGCGEKRACRWSARCAAVAI